MIEYSRQEINKFIEETNINEEIDIFIKAYFKINIENTYVNKIACNELYKFLEFTRGRIYFTNGQLANRLKNNYKIKVSDYDKEKGTKYFLGISVKTGYKKIFKNVIKDKYRNAIF